MTDSTRQEALLGTITPSSDPLFYYEQFGTLTYLVGDDVKTFTGWVLLGWNDRSISARKKYGRNTWHLTNTDRVIEFVKVKP